MYTISGQNLFHSEYEEPLCGIDYCGDIWFYGNIYSVCDNTVILFNVISCYVERYGDMPDIVKDMILSGVVDDEICEYAKFIYEDVRHKIQIIKNKVYEYIETGVVTKNTPSYMLKSREYSISKFKLSSEFTELLKSNKINVVDAYESIRYQTTLILNSMKHIKSARN